MLIQESAAKAGIKIKIVREPDDDYGESVWNKNAGALVVQIAIHPHALNGR